MPIPNSGGKRITVRADSQKELEKLVMETKIKIEMGILTVNNNTTFERYAEHWLKTYKRGTVSDKSYRQYKSSLKLHINPVLGNLKMRDIKKSQCMRVLSEHAGQSRSLVEKLRMTMVQIFDAAIDDEIILRNPAYRLPLPETTSNTHRPVTDDERIHILRVSETHYAGLWVLVMLYCGLRPSEASALQWGDVDLKNKIISVKRSIYREATKTKAGMRRIPFPDELVNKFIEAKKKAKSIYIFTTGENNPLNEDKMRRWWNSFRRALDIDMGAIVYRNQIVASVIANDLTPYCLRHTYATDMQAAGIPLNIAKVWLGHSDIKMTADVYTHYTADNEREARMLLDGYRSAATMRQKKRKAL